MNRGRSQEAIVAQQHAASPFPMEGVGAGVGDLRQPGLPREAPAPRGLSVLRPVRAARGPATGPLVLIRSEATRQFAYPLATS